MQWIFIGEGRKSCRKDYYGSVVGHKSSGRSCEQKKKKRGKGTLSLLINDGFFHRSVAATLRIFLALSLAKKHHIFVFLREKFEAGCTMIVNL
jgi:hypothetical protein